MTFDEYNAYMASITKELQAIADRTLNQALLGIANASNPMFVELMQWHAYLTKLSSEITEKMVAMLNTES